MIVSVCVVFLVATISSVNGYIEFKSSNFEDVLKSDVFVDKSMLIKEYFNRFGFLFISAPGRFFRTTNLDMIRRFMQIQFDEKGNKIESEALKRTKNYKLFQENNLKIYQDSEFFEKHFGQHPVIYMDLLNLPVDTYASFKFGYQELLRKLFLEHEFLLKYPNETMKEEDLRDLVDDFNTYTNKSMNWTSASDNLLAFGIQKLSYQLFERVNKSGVLLLDNYDAPIKKAVRVKGSDVTKIVRFIRLVTINALEANPYLDGGILSGFFGLKHFFSYDPEENVIPIHFLEDEKIFKYYGFTMKEVFQIFKRFNLTCKFKSFKDIYGFNKYVMVEKKNKKLGIIQLDNLVADVKELRSKVKDYEFQYDRDLLENFKCLCKKHHEFHHDLLQSPMGNPIDIDQWTYFNESQMESLKYILLNNDTNPNGHFLNQRSLYYHYLLEKGFYKMYYKHRLYPNATKARAALQPANKEMDKIFINLYFKGLHS